MAYTGIIQGQRGAGNGLAANQKPDIWKAMGLLEPYNYPATQYLFFGSKPQKPVRNKKGKYSWMEDELLPHNVTVSVAVTASAGKLTLTNVNVDLVDAFTVNDLVYIEDNDEMGIVESTATNQAVLSAPDGTNLSSITGTGGIIKILASMFTEGSAAPISKTTEEVEVSNYLTIMKATVSSTGRDQAGESFTDGTSQAEQVSKKMKEMKFQFERLAFLSMSSGNASSAGALVQTWGKGLLGMLTSNIQTTATLSESTFDTWLQLIGQKGSPNKLIYAGSARYYEIQDIIKAKLNGLTGNTVITKYGVDVTKYKYGHLNIDLVFDPVLDGKFTNWAFGVDKGKFMGRFMANDKKGSRKLRIERGVEAPGTDGTTDLILSDIGAQYMNEETGGILKA